jgi:hypothetical protein
MASLALPVAVQFDPVTELYPCHFYPCQSMFTSSFCAISITDIISENKEKMKLSKSNETNKPTHNTAQYNSTLVQSASSQGSEKQKEWFILTPEQPHPIYEHFQFIGPVLGLNDCENPPITPKGVFDLFLTDKIVNFILEKSNSFRLSERYWFGTEKAKPRHCQMVNG